MPSRDDTRRAELAGSSRAIPRVVRSPGRPVVRSSEGGASPEVISRSLSFGDADQDGGGMMQTMPSPATLAHARFPLHMPVVTVVPPQHG